MQAEQVRVVRFDVIGARAVPLRKRVAEQTYLERRRDAARDLVLNREDVRELAVVRSGPKMRVGRDVDELRGDPDVAASSANTAFEHVIDAERGSDRFQIRVSASERERRRAGRHVQAGDVREHVQQLFGDAVAEIVLGGIGADRREGQHRDRLHSGLRRSGSGRGRARVIALAPFVEDERGHREDQRGERDDGEMAVRDERESARRGACGVGDRGRGRPGIRPPRGRFLTRGAGAFGLRFRRRKRNRCLSQE